MPQATVTRNAKLERSRWCRDTSGGDGTDQDRTRYCLWPRWALLPSGQHLLHGWPVRQFRCVLTGASTSSTKVTNGPTGKVTESGPTERALLISHLHDQFWSKEYYEAAELVREWSGGENRDWAADLFRELDRLGALPEARRLVVERTNAARRLIKSYFRKTQQFCSHGFLEPEDLRSYLTMARRLEMLFEIIEPFEGARQPDYNREMFDFYDELHRGKLERPER